MTFGRAATFVLLAVASCTRRAPAPPSDPAAPSLVVPVGPDGATDAGAPVRPAGPSPFAIVTSYANRDTSVKMHRLGRGAVLVETSRDEKRPAWLARELRKDGTLPVVPAAISSRLDPRDDPWEVQGASVDDLWLTLNTNANPPTAGGGGSYVMHAAAKVTGSLATHYSGVTPWEGGRVVGLRWRGFIGYLVSEPDVAPRTLVVLEGPIADLPQAPKNVSLVDVIPEAGGSFLGIGLEVVGNAAPWEMYRLRVGKTPERAGLAGLEAPNGQWYLVHGAGPGDLVAYVAGDSVTTFVTWSDALRPSTLPFAVDSVSRSTEGTLWIVADRVLHRTSGRDVAGGVLPTTKVPLPSPEVVRAAVPDCKDDPDPGTVLALADDDVWVTASCGCGEGCARTLLLHTQAAAKPVAFPHVSEMRAEFLRVRNDAGAPR